MDKSSHSTSEVRKSWSESCHSPKCSRHSFDVKKLKKKKKGSHFQACQPGGTGDLLGTLVELFEMPSLLWLSFQFPFVLVHFHGSITRPIIIFSFYLFFFIATQDKKKKRPLVTSHLVYGRLLTLLIRMLFSEPTCQWHTIKPAFQIRTFMAMEMFLTNGNIQMWADCWVRDRRSSKVSLATIVSFWRFASLTWRMKHALEYYGKVTEVQNCRS